MHNSVSGRLKQPLPRNRRRPMIAGTCCQKVGSQSTCSAASVRSPPTRLWLRRAVCLRYQGRHWPAPSVTSRPLSASCQRRVNHTRAADASHHTATSYVGLRASQRCAQSYPPPTGTAPPHSARDCPILTSPRDAISVERAAEPRSVAWTARRRRSPRSRRSCRRSAGCSAAALVGRMQSTAAPRSRGGAAPPTDRLATPRCQSSTAAVASTSVMPSSASHSSLATLTLTPPFFTLP